MNKTYHPSDNKLRSCGPATSAAPTPGIGRYEETELRKYSLNLAIGFTGGDVDQALIVAEKLYQWIKVSK